MSARLDRSNDVRRRRRLETVLLVLAAAVVGVLTTSVSAAFGGERVVQMWVTATITGDGSAQITEVIDWDFGANERHGIIREVPGLRTSAPVAVSSPDAPNAVDVSTAGTPRIRIGDPDRTVSGLHRYVVTYTLDGVVRGDRLAWNAVGTHWAAPIESVEVHVMAPTALEGAGCTTGTAGSGNPCAIRSIEPGHVVARIDGLDAGEGVTVSAATGAALGGTPGSPPPPAVAAASMRGVNPFLVGVLTAGTALLSAALTSLLLLRAGRERVPTVGVPVTASPGGQGRIDLAELAGHVVASPSLPAGLSPAHGGVLLAGRVLDQHNKAAWLIDQAVDGVVDLVPDGTAADEMTVIRLRPGDPAAGPLLDIAFGGRDRVTLGAYDRNFARMWDALGRELSDWRSVSGLCDPAADRRARRTRVIGTLVGVAGAALAVFGHLAARQADLPLLLAGFGGALAGAGAAAAIRGWELRVFTPAVGGLAAGRVVAAIPRTIAADRGRPGGRTPGDRAVHGVGGRPR